MRIAILSDTHFGDPMCSLASRIGAAAPELGPAYSKFKAAVGEDLDYLVLVGDIFDFSVASYSEAYRAAKPFFQRIAQDGTLKRVDGKPRARIVYVPGNHDTEAWHHVEYEVNVIRRMHAGAEPRGFRWAVPGVFDLRRGTTHEVFTLADRGQDDDRFECSGLFLDSLTAGNGSTDPDERFPFCVAYPNLYVLTDEDCVLITHGHYLERYWAFLGEIAPLVAGSDLNVSHPPSIRQIVALNLPLSQLACSGIGQAGPLTQLVQLLQREVKDRKFDRVARYLERLDDEVLDKMADYGWADPREWASDLCINTTRSQFLDFLKQVKEARYDDEFLLDPDSQQRFSKYYQACQSELGGICRAYGYAKPEALPEITHVMYGHTHVPTPWENRRRSIRIDGRSIALNNFGGWLYRQRSAEGGTLEGAEVVLIESGTIRSMGVV